MRDPGEGVLELRQKQFLDVVDDAEAHRRFDAICGPLEPRAEEVPLERALGRVLWEDLRSRVDVPGFDRSNMDGFAVRARDTFGAQELDPRRLRVMGPPIAAGPQKETRPPELEEGTAIPIATGALIPRGADAVVMIEDTAPSRATDREIDVFRPVSPGKNLSGAGSDVGRGEIVLHRRTLLGSRETALIAAVGVDRVAVFAKPRVAVFSTGDEIRPPGAELAVGEIHDSNSRIICDAVAELGAEPDFRGIIRDDEPALEAAMRAVLGGKGEMSADFVILSGGTSKGAGDLNYRIVERLAGELPDSPGIVVHGVALKPGKPLCLAGLAGCPLAILPGFPTSAIFTFHEFIAPVIARLTGRPRSDSKTIDAVVPVRIPSAIGRTEYLLVDLVPSGEGYAAYPLGAGSGSVSTFSMADGFVRIDRLCEYLAEGEGVKVQPIGKEIRPADLVVIGSHCVGLDLLLGVLSSQGHRVKAIPVGSQAGLAALARAEGDLAGCHLLDAATGVYNQPFLPPGARIIGGYGRRQGIVFRRGDERFAGRDLDALARSVGDPGVRMVNRNPGSGTRTLIDGFLERGGEKTPEGYHAQARSHHAVAAAVAQGRADWGITLDVLAKEHELDFVFLQDERFDLIVRDETLKRPAVVALREVLAMGETKELLRGVGMVV